MEQKNEKNWQRIIIWILFGILVCTSLTSAHISSSVNLNKFYDVGQVYDINKSGMKRSFGTCDYEEDTKSHVVLGDRASMKFNVSGSVKKCNYLCFEVENLSKPEMEWVIRYFDKEGKWLKDEPYIITEGMNVLSIENMPIGRIQLKLYNLAGESFKINSIQFRENVPVFTLARYVRIAAFFYIIYMIVSFFLWYLFVKNGWKFHITFSGVSKFLQYIFLLFLNPKIGNNRKYITKYIGQIRTGLFLAIILYINLAAIFNNYLRYYKYHMLVCSVLLLLIGILSIENKLTYIQIESPIVTMGICLSLMMCLSDIIVKKTIPYVGFIALFALGYVIFVWCQMKHPKKLMKEFFMAIKLSFAIVLLLNIVLRGKEGGYCYNGIFSDSRDYAVYLCIVFVLFLSEILSDVINNNYKKNNALNCTGGLLCIYNIYITHYWPVISIVFICLIGALIQFVIAYRKQQKKENIHRIMITGAALAIPVILIYILAVTYLPFQIGSSIRYQKDSRIIAESIRAFLFDGNLEKTFDQKIQVMTAYFRNFNLFGNRKNVRLWGKLFDAQNSYIAMMYSYGLFTAIPYVMLIYNSIKGAVLSQRKTKNDVHMLAVIYGLSAMALLGIFVNTIRPFESLSWLFCFMCAGYMVQKGGNRMGQEKGIERS